MLCQYVDKKKILGPFFMICQHVGKKICCVCKKIYCIYKNFYQHVDKKICYVCKIFANICKIIHYDSCIYVKLVSDPNICLLAIFSFFLSLAPLLTFCAS